MWKAEGRKSCCAIQYISEVIHHGAGMRGVRHFVANQIEPLSLTGRSRAEGVYSQIDYGKVFSAIFQLSNLVG